ncbi:MAG TPA: hypothetical protein VH913_03045 [Hyphomicrobiaceae bacterium]
MVDMADAGTTVVLGIPIPSTDPTFLAIVGVHILFGIGAVTAGAIAVLSRTCPCGRSFPSLHSGSCPARSRPLLIVFAALGHPVVASFDRSRRASPADPR